MALYIDFNFINIRDLIDFSEVDLEFENQVESFVEEVFENPVNKAQVFEESAIKFLSEIVVENDVSASAETAAKDVADIIATPVIPAVTTKKTRVDKNEAYIKYINSRYEQAQADYFIDILLNPMQTHFRKRFDYRDARNRYLQAQILSKDKDSTEKAEEKRRKQDKKNRNLEEERRIEAIKRNELHGLFESNNRRQYERI